MRRKYLYRTLLLSNILLVLANPDFHEGKVKADEKTNTAEVKLQFENFETSKEDFTDFQIPEANPYTAPPSSPQEAPKTIQQLAWKFKQFPNQMKLNSLRRLQ